MNEKTFPFHPRVGDQHKRRVAAKHPSGEPHLVYVYSDDLVLAVNAALATQRPLLLRGTPGSGKSTLAADAAHALGREYLDEVITSRTTATDLQWRFDTVGRLSDATADPASARDRAKYVQRGVLWRAYEKAADGRGAVVLLDEIDKADPDVPNDLLVAIGEGEFVVTDLEPPRRIIRERDVLVVITTNGERELAPAFLRRCVSLTLDDPSKDARRMLDIVNLHLARYARTRNKAIPELGEDALATFVARVEELAPAVGSLGRRPGTAEILDALKAAYDLGIAPGTSDWKTLTRVLLYKDSGNPDKKS
jgi:MoxR-like ATPase